MYKRSLAVAAAAAVVLPLAGCTTADSVDHAASQQPRTLELAFFDADSALDPALDWFIDHLSDVSGGRLHVKVYWECCGEGRTTAGSESGVIDTLAKDDVDLGVVGVRALDVSGVTQLDGLLAPLQINSYAEQQAVLSDATVRKTALSVRSIGGAHTSIVGLLPGPERYPLSTSTRPLLSVDDWHGKEIHTVVNHVQNAAVAALGATPSSREDRDDRLQSGELGGIENSLLWYGEYASDIRAATMNVGLWPKPNAVLMSAKARSELSARERGWVTEAARRTVADTSQLRRYEETYTRVCSFPDAIAPPEAIAGLVAAVRPVHDALAADSSSAPVLARVDALAGPPAAAEPPAGC